MGFVQVNESLCVGCRYCELFCVYRKQRVCEPSRTRIRVEKREHEGSERPVVCRQCESPACAEACPTGALVRDERAGIVAFDDEACTRCQACVEACPYASIWYHEETDAILKCDFCGGDPECVKRCPTKALTAAASAEGR